MIPIISHVTSKHLIQIGLFHNSLKVEGWVQEVNFGLFALSLDADYVIDDCGYNGVLKSANIFLAHALVHSYLPWAPVWIHTNVYWVLLFVGSFLLSLFSWVDEIVVSFIQHRDKVIPRGQLFFKKWSSYFGVITNQHKRFLFVRWNRLH